MFYVHKNLDTYTSQLFTQCISKFGYDPKNFRGVSIDDLPLVKEIVESNIFIHDFDIQEGEYVGGIARRCIGKFEKTVKLLRKLHELKATQTTTWFGKPVPISVSISLNLIDQPIFLYNKDPQKLLIDFVIKLELLAEKSELQMRTKFQEVERVVNEPMSKYFQ